MPVEVKAQVDFGRSIREHLEIVEGMNTDEVDAVAALMLKVIRSGGLIYTAGTGHSLAMVMESFYRAGGLACVRPLYHPALLPLEGARFSTHSEKTSGLAAGILEKARPTKDDMAFIFSHSAANAVPVELAIGLHEKQVPIVAVASKVHISSAGRHPTVLEFATHVLDTRVPYGDATCDTFGGARTAPISTLVGAFLWNLLLSRLAALAAHEHIVLPVWTSSNVKDGEERNHALMNAYMPRVPEL